MPAILTAATRLKLVWHRLSWSPGMGRGLNGYDEGCVSSDCLSVAVKNGTRMAAKDGARWRRPVAPCIASTNLRSGSTKGATTTLLQNNNASVCGTKAHALIEVYQLAAEVAHFFTGTDNRLGLQRSPFGWTMSSMVVSMVCHARAMA